MKKTTIQDFLDKAHQVHGDKYDYSKVEYKGVDHHITIICPIHGEFSQTPYGHTKGKGCKQCGIASAVRTKTSDTTTFIEKAKAIHGDKYDYSTVVYTSAKSKVTITCPDHGPFDQLVSGHLSGYGCKHCASHGKGRVDMNKPCILYYLKFPDFGYYKIGITTRSVDKRYRTTFERSQFEVVFTKTFSTGREAYEFEQSCIKTYSSFKYTGPKLLNNGNTELFTKDIFEGNYPHE